MKEDNMYKMIKKWWRPSKFTVVYSNKFGMELCYDKFEYNNLEDATKRQDHLLNCSPEELLKEGFDFWPNYVNIEKVIEPNPVRRLLNWYDSKKNYTILK